MSQKQCIGNFASIHRGPTARVLTFFLQQLLSRITDAMKSMNLVYKHAVNEALNIMKLNVVEISNDIPDLNRNCFVVWLHSTSLNSAATHPPTQSLRGLATLQHHSPHG
jgi:hypothetical protein